MDFTEKDNDLYEEQNLLAAKLRAEASRKKISDFVDAFKKNITAAIGRYEYDDEECGARFEFTDLSTLFRDQYKFVVTIPDYGGDLKYNEIIEIISNVPDNTSATILLNEEEKMKIEFLIEY